MTDPRTTRPSDPAARPDGGEGRAPAPAAPGASETWFDDLPGDPQVTPAAAATETSAAPRPSRRLWLAAGSGAAVIAVASVVGIGVVRATAGDDDGGDDGTSDAAGGPGGGFPGGGQGFPAGGGFPGGGATGTVTGVDGSTFTVENAEGEAVTVTTSDDTTYSESIAGDLGDVEAGDDVLVMGSGDDEIEARTVVVGALDGQGGPGGGFPGGGGLATGTVEGVTDDGFTVDTGDGTVTVTVTSDATITVAEEATLDDVSEGDTVRVTGEAGDDDRVTADSVSLGDAGLGTGGIP